MIFENITEYNKRGTYPFHMPGHKRNKNFFKDINFLDYDMTEFGDMDNFHNPSGIIDRSQKMAAELFGSDRAYYLTNGSTSGIMAAICSVCQKDDKILIARNSHRSAYNAVVIADAEPIYLYPCSGMYGLAGGISPSDVESALKENPDIKAVFITSPTYDGFCSDIKTISQITRNYGKILIIDEAHGSHFVFSKYFPDSAINYAEIVIQSLHKTMPSLGQSSILHSNGRKIDNNLLEYYISLFHTTSPSYIILAFLDRLIKNLFAKEITFDEYVDLLLEYRERYNFLNYIRLIDKEVINSGCVSDFDISKLNFFLGRSGLQGETINKLLSQKFNIQIELFSKYHFMALSTVCDTRKGFEMLEVALHEIEKELHKAFEDIKILPKIPKPQIRCGIKEALHRKRLSLPIRASIGRISSDFIIPYPPGIPLVVPGEIITEGIFNVVNELILSGVELIGCEHDSSSQDLRINVLQ